MKKKYEKKYFQNLSLDSLNELILTFFYCGKSKYAPGTVGTICAVFIWIWINDFFSVNYISAIIQYTFWSVIILAFFFHSLIGIKRYQITKNSLNIDHKSIVIDEVVGIFIGLEIFNFTTRDLYVLNQTKFLIYVMFCTILFRILDITKPSFIGICDKKLKNSLGVMLDDILCGIISGISTLILYKYSVNSYFFKLINCD